MGILRTHLRLAALTFGLIQSAPATAWTSAPTDPLYVFAQCTGRLSALMEHQWMFDGPASEDTARARQTMIDLLKTAQAASTVSGSTILSWRIEAKQAQAHLLTQAVFAHDHRRARQAQQLSLRYLRECQTLLLG